MKRTVVAATFLSAILAVAGDARAQESKFLLGIESRPTATNHELDLNLAPNFSFRLSERFRLDASAGVLYSELDGYTVRLYPGFRYYFRPSGKLRLNSGASLGFELFDETDDRGPIVAGALAKADGLADAGAPGLRDDGVSFRLVPLELEYWAFRRTALTFAFDHESTPFDNDDFESDGYGVAVGLRFRLK